MYNAKNARIRWELLDRNHYKLRKAKPHFVFFFGSWFCIEIYKNSYGSLRKLMILFRGLM